MGNILKRKDTPHVSNAETAPSVHRVRRSYRVAPILDDTDPIEVVVIPSS